MIIELTIEEANEILAQYFDETLHLNECPECGYDGLYGPCLRDSSITYLFKALDSIKNNNLIASYELNWECIEGHVFKIWFVNGKSVKDKSLIVAIAKAIITIKIESKCIDINKDGQ